MGRTTVTETADDLTPSPSWGAPERGYGVRPFKSPSLRSPLLVLLALVALAALVVATSASAGVSPGPANATNPASSPLALAAVRSAAASAALERAMFSLTLSGGKALGAPAPRASGAAAFDLPARRGTLTLSVAGSDPDRSFIFTPEAVYLRSPLAAGSLVRPGAWTAVRFSDTRSVRRDLPDLIGQLESLNPSLTLSELVWGATSASASGQQLVLGQLASAYDLTVQPAQALVNATGSEPAFAIALESQMSALARTSRIDGAFPGFRARVWLSAAGRLLRVELSPPGAGVGKLGLTMGGSGAPVLVVPPPAGQVVDLASLIPSGERENFNGGDSDGG